MIKNAALLNSYRILLIEDDSILRNSMAVFFKNRTKRFITAEKAEEGLRLLGKESFDTIICDYRLPGMDGIRFFQELEERKVIGKRILISAYIDKRVARSALSSGVHCVVPKPFDLQTIIDVIIGA